ncbi:MAG: penicillin-binding protein 2 [Rhodospirillaceae bacterium]|nr:penicillin-binding protein 2 [Rhodospirillaceae bacterium]
MMITRDSDWVRMFNRRAALLGGGQALLVGALAARLYYLQVIEAERYRMLAEDNRINIRLLPPPRGRILDRFGQALAVNQQNFRVLIVPEQGGDLKATLAALSNIVPLTDHDRERVRKEAARSRGFLPITIRENLTWEEMARVQVNAPDLPGVVIDEGLTRHYPQFENAAHVLGYVAAVDEDDLTGDPLLQLPGFRIGKAGIERIYDPALRGRGGTSQVEVNAYGRIIRELSRQEGEPGADVTLTLDARLQRFAADRLGAESASVMVMDIHTGEILVMASTPSFDANAFSRGLTQAEWKELSTDPRSPLTNKSIAGQYSPGSTFKIAVALAALEHGVIAPDQHVYCNGHLSLGSRRFHCWKEGGHGGMDMVQALSQSCDVYFYDVARRLGVDRIAAMSRKLGLGEVSSLGLPGEQKGLIPTEAWKKAATGESWQQGDTFNVGIGQGYVLTTPVQLLTMVARLANGGIAVTPRLTKAAQPPTGALDGANAATGDTAAPASFAALGLPAEHVAIVRRGIWEVVNGPRGTARASHLRFKKDPLRKDWQMSGKTGTTQVRRFTLAEREAGLRSNDELPWELRNHALFVAYAPEHQPRYAMSVLVEHGGGGAAVAAPIARDVMEEVLRLDPVGALGVTAEQATATPPPAPAAPEQPT